MSQSQLEREGFRHNPQSISQQVIDTTIYLIGSKSEDELDEHWSDAGFTEIFSPQFQKNTIGVDGWQIQITDEQRAKYGVTATSVDNMGLTSDKDRRSPTGYYQYFGSIRAIRTLVGGSFIEQARADGLPLSELDINDELIDAQPCKKEELGEVYAEEEGIFMLDADNLEAQWKEENGVLYEDTMGIIEGFVERLTPRSIVVLSENLPEELATELEPEIRDRWQHQLRDTALRTYAIFTPNAPVLIPIPVKENG